MVGEDASLRAYCPNCQSWARHRLIGVTGDITLAWCEHCRVPRLYNEIAGPAPPEVTPPPTTTRIDPKPPRALNPNFRTAGPWLIWDRNDRWPPKQR